MYGRSVKHQGQRVGLAHVLEDEDVVCAAVERQCIVLTFF